MLRPPGCRQLKGASRALCGIADLELHRARARVHAHIPLVSTKLFVWLTLQLFFTVQVSRKVLTYVVKNTISRAYAKQISPMDSSYGSQDGSNDLLHAQIRARAPEIREEKSLLLYRFLKLKIHQNLKVLFI